MESSCLFWCLYHQVHDFFISRPTATNPQHVNVLKVTDINKSTTNSQQIHNKSATSAQHVHNRSTTNRGSRERAYQHECPMVIWQERIVLSYLPGGANVHPHLTHGFQTTPNGISIGLDVSARLVGRRRHTDGHRDHDTEYDRRMVDSGVFAATYRHSDVV